jgi:hypothetical protein
MTSGAPEKQASHVGRVRGKLDTLVANETATFFTYIQDATINTGITILYKLFYIYVQRKHIALTLSLMFTTGEDGRDIIIKSDSAGACALRAVTLRIFRVARPPTRLVADC